MSDNFETLMWGYILENSTSGIGQSEEYVDGVPVEHFYSPRFARLFCRIFDAGPRWQWGLVWNGFFNSRRVIHMRENQVAFVTRVDTVGIAEFQAYGLSLMYSEIDDVETGTSSDEY